MCRPTSTIWYTEACGHYILSHSEDGSSSGACPKAIKLRLSPDFIEWSPCATLICELESQRKGKWDWEAIIDGVVIRVLCASSGHCEAWRRKNFKKQDYAALAQTAKAEKLEQEKKENKAAHSENGTSGPSNTVESRDLSSISTSIGVGDAKVKGMRDKFKRGVFKF